MNRNQDVIFFIILFGIIILISTYIGLASVNPYGIATYSLEEDYSLHPCSSSGDKYADC